MALVFLVIGMALAVQLIRPVSHYPPYCLPPQETDTKSDFVSFFPILLLIIAITYTLFTPTYSSSIDEKLKRNRVPIQEKNPYTNRVKKRFVIEIASSKSYVSLKRVANKFRQPMKIIRMKNDYKLITTIGFRSYQDAENYLNQQGLPGNIVAY